MLSLAPAARSEGRRRIKTQTPTGEAKMPLLAVTRLARLQVLRCALVPFLLAMCGTAQANRYTIVDLGPLMWMESSAINAAGHIAATKVLGRGGGRASVWRSGHWRKLSSEDSGGLAINGRGDV